MLHIKSTKLESEGIFFKINVITYEKQYVICYFASLLWKNIMLMQHNRTDCRKHFFFKYDEA